MICLWFICGHVDSLLWWQGMWTFSISNNFQNVLPHCRNSDCEPCYACNVSEKHTKTSWIRTQNAHTAEKTCERITVAVTQNPTKQWTIGGPAGGRSASTFSAPWRETTEHCCFPLSIHPLTPLCFRLSSFTHPSIHPFIWLDVHPCPPPSVLSHGVMLPLKTTSPQPAISPGVDLLLLWQFP